MKIVFYNSLPSTQIYLKEKIRKKELYAPIAVVAERQTDGIGSRNNRWVSMEGNIFFSFAITLSVLPSDLKLESASIYFAYILKETLTTFGSHLILKWPNDLYIGEKKIAGVITSLVDDVVICGVGLNLLSCEEEFGVLDIKIDKNILLEHYFQNIDKKVLWKQVFSKYKLEFQTNKKFFTNQEGRQISLEKVILEDDGSISIDGKRMYSRR